MNQGRSVGRREGGRGGKVGVSVKGEAQMGGCEGEKGSERKVDNY